MVSLSQIKILLVKLKLHGNDKTRETRRLLTKEVKSVVKQNETTKSKN